MKKIVIYLSYLILWGIFPVGNIYSQVVLEDNIKGTSLSDVSLSDILSWKSIFNRNNCSSLFSGKISTLRFSKGEKSLEFKSEPISVLYEDGCHFMGRVRPDKTASSFIINRIARTSHDSLGEVSLVYIGRQNFVNQRKWYNDNGHVNILPVMGHPTVNISEGFFVLFKMKRQDFQKQLGFLASFFENNIILASDSVDSDEVFVIGDLKNFILKKDSLASNIPVDISRYLSSFNRSKLSNERRNSLSYLRSSEDTSIIKTPRYRLNDKRRRVSPKKASSLIVGINDINGSVSSYGTILKRQLEYLSSSVFINEVAMSNPYLAIEESFKLTESLVDQYFNDNPSLDREVFDNLRLQLMINSQVTDDWNPSDRELRGKIFSVSSNNYYLEQYYPEIFRINSLYKMPILKDENGLYIRKTTVSFIMVRRGDVTYMKDFLSSDVIHMQYFYFKYMDLARYLDRNGFVTGGTLEIERNVNTGKAEKVTLINDGVFSLQRREKIRMNADDKKHLFEHLRENVPMRSNHMIVTEKIIAKD